MARLKVLVIDWETTGIRDDSAPFVNFLEGPQGIEIGAVVLDLNTLTTGEEFNRHCRFLGTHKGIQYDQDRFSALTWSEKAETIHGMKIEALAVEAAHPNQVGREFAEYVRRNFGDNRVMMAGHNPVGDRYFTKQLLYIADQDIRFHHRMLDTFTGGYLLWGAESSDELFSIVSDIRRKNHSAIQDARLTAKALCEMVRFLKQPT